jgi:hypothetical protein
MRLAAVSVLFTLATAAAVTAQEPAPTAAARDVLRDTVRGAIRWIARQAVA